MVASRVTPGARERLMKIRDSRPADLDPGIAPLLDPALRVTDPLFAHTKAGDEPDLAVDGDGLAVIAAKPGERTVEPGRIEGADFDAGGEQFAPESARGPEASQPVVKQTDANSTPRFG